MIRRKLIQDTVNELLNELGITSPPVDVEAVARHKGAVVVKEPNKDDFSGFLYRSPDSPPIIGVNSLHSLNRKRFTVAHEIAHLCLHPRSGVHVDQAFVQMRDAKASEGVDEEEMEANRFAAELLMPKHFLLKDLSALGRIYADDEKEISNLAKKYEVSSQAMAIRLSSLHLIWM